MTELQETFNPRMRKSSPSSHNSTHIFEFPKQDGSCNHADISDICCRRRTIRQRVQYLWLPHNQGQFKLGRGKMNLMGFSVVAHLKVQPICSAFFPNKQQCSKSLGHLSQDLDSST
ncbi:hypothetical protein SCLCIDRAFT_760343 [Scleroderma citrinum Foug A]|uniref:Uncharacterized protein n=1 Tax=Scleroderma citrinum Foug A TaxID=1036808 RepID=A0A0C2ZNT0_9AGAM|nr:hypothetical protein SCLCIDRAFT_760343 [Scleroderma citrinum Foug A]